MRERVLRKICGTMLPFHVLLLLLAGLEVWSPLGVLGQEPKEHDALCNADGCYAAYFQRSTFRDALQMCKERGGHLATVKTQEQAELIHELLSNTERRTRRLRLWIGLQRQPRQCSATRPLRGFTWVSGDQDTEYTNWLREDPPGTCSAPRCVVMTHNTADKSRSNKENFKWLDGSCYLAVDGHLCRFTYRGMCHPLGNEGGGPALYTTPFNLVTALLTHIPFGSTATLPCPGEEAPQDQSVLCTMREDGDVGWSREIPLCAKAKPKNWCEPYNGGCQHLCLNTDNDYYCACQAGYELDEDGRSCKLHLDVCADSQCEHRCDPTPNGYRCTCPNGYLLAPDGKSCLDIDECERDPCPQLCVNLPGTFECRCEDGYQADEDGDCQDVDECLEDSCEQICQNTPGSYECQCADGYTPVPEDPARCQDVDECETLDHTCHQICRNYAGGFDCQCHEGYELEDDYQSCRKLEDPEVPGEEDLTPTEPTDGSTGSEGHDLSWSPGMPDWLTEPTPLEWLTEMPSLEWLPTNMAWFTDMPSQEEANSHEAWHDAHPAHELLPNPTPPPYNPYHDQTVLIGAGGNSVESYGSHHDSSTGVRVDEVYASEEAGEGGPGASSSPPHGKEGNEGDEGEAAEETGGRPGGGKRRHDKSWLLVALLVPLCVFIVVMLALGIVYCTSCAVEPRSKGSADCYRWFHATKPAAETVPAATTPTAKTQA